MFGVLTVSKPRLIGWAIFIGAILSAALLLYWNATRPLIYEAEAIRGRVIDAQTKMPIVGANVLAFWPVYVGSHYQFVGMVEVKEAVTDENGDYVIDGWGPVEWTGEGRIEQTRPRIWFFQAGYFSYNPYNDDPGKPDYFNRNPASRHLTSFWNGRTVELKPYKPDANPLIRLSDTLPDISYFFHRADRCDWPKAARFLRSVISYVNGAPDESLLLSSFTSKVPGCPDPSIVLGGDFKR